MIASEHPEVIEGRRRLITTYALDSEEASEDGFIDNDGAYQDEEDGTGSGEAGVSTGVNEAGTKEAEEIQYTAKYSSLQSYILKPTSLTTQGFKGNNKEQ